ncbi:hypothetical protein VKT23_018065 [Stygiomarasmius scandens]|uniref:F-box domain-containing protein n=1 Tax=Marasmiellus scandens TaxID=2682957 RepID=A0ABR1IQE4_9AGAR
MDELPIEIVTLIFSYACLDNGYTGRSLSLVSKSIRDLSQHFKLQSISIIGYNQLQSFASLLAETPPSFRRVRFLFIAAHARNTAEDPRVLDSEYQRKEDAYKAYERVLWSVRDTVEMLHVFFIFYRSFLLVPVDLPVLTELALHGRMDMDGPTGIKIHNGLRLPALKHLYITSPFPPRHITSGLTVLTPALEHLRLSVPDHVESFLSELQHVLQYLASCTDAAETGAHAQSETSVLRLKTVLLHCPSKPKDNWMNRMDRYDEQMRLLHELVSEHARTGLVKLVSPLKMGLFRTVTIEDAEGSWNARVNGRDAWWEDGFRGL